MTKKAVILFTKAPIKGTVKTRMQSLLSPEECAKLQENMILDTFISCKNNKWDLFIAYTPKSELRLMETLCANAAGYILQNGFSLGDKMADAIEQTLNRGYNSCILIGSDIPALKTKDIEDAFNLLETTDVVFGPTLDKGYYLVGMNELKNEVFQNQLYGTANVLEQTLTRIQGAGISTGLLAYHHDMDTPNDLYRFYDENVDKKTTHAPNTQKYIQYLMGVYNKR